MFSFHHEDVYVILNWFDRLIRLVWIGPYNTNLFCLYQQVGGQLGVEQILMTEKMVCPFVGSRVLRAIHIQNTEARGPGNLFRIFLAGSVKPRMSCILCTVSASRLVTSPLPLQLAPASYIAFNMKTDASSIQGGGMSRASKKRAKKHQKTLEHKLPATKRAVENNIEVVDSKRVKMDAEEGKKSKIASTTFGEPASGKKVFENDDRDNLEDNDADDEQVATGAQKEEQALILDPSDSYIPSLPNASLTEILMVDSVKNENRKQLIASLSSSQRATCLFKAIIDPIPLDQFYTEYWEKKPLLVRGKGNTRRYQNLLSLHSIRRITKDHKLYYGQDLNVTRYQLGTDGIKRRVTLDKLTARKEGALAVDPAELWSNYDQGCTIRLLCPHKHADNVHALLSTLELELKCMVGANAYLTPPKSSQGFAPHYDDIEAFCLQLEGSKRWKVYEPTFKLPRVSSEDFTPEDLEGMTPVMDVTLEEGDLLYMPRGWIHQACTLPNDAEHSLHLTISAMQQWSWADLLEIVLPEAIENAAMNKASISLRQGLPRGFMDYMGAMYEEPSDEKLPESLKKVDEDDEEKKSRRVLQEQFRADAKKRIMKVAKTAYEMIDAACDQMAKRFMSDRQPFALAPDEKGQTCAKQEIDILPNTLCRLVRPGVARLLIEDDKAVVYHCGDNSREYHGKPLSPIEYEMDDGPAIEQLLTTIEPHWIFVNDLFHDSIEDKIAIAQSLYDEGILAVKSQDGDAATAE
jgi:lysine-specific demethylase/histidyl-hydroxylase NO66